jgi:hypothetical protein
MLHHSSRAEKIYGTWGLSVISLQTNERGYPIEIEILSYL